MIGLPWHKIAMNSVGTIIITTTSSQGPLLSPLSSRCGEVRLYINIPGGGGGTRYNGLCGEAPSERDTFLRPQVYERARDFTY